MNAKRLIRIAIFGLLALILISLISAAAATNTVPAYRMDDVQRPLTPNDLKPPECASINLTTKISCPAGGGNCNGTNGNDLILGSPNNDTIRGRNGDDCILGGAGDDDIDGGNGADVCIGGPGNNQFLRCETVVP